MHVVHLLHAMVLASTTPPIDPSTLQQIPDGATAQFNATLPLGITAFLLFVGLGIALKVFGKVGIKR